MKKFISLIISIVVVFSMTSISFATTDEVASMDTKPSCFSSMVPLDKNVTVMIENDGYDIIVPIFDGSIEVNSTQKLPGIVTYSGYWKIHSWIGTNFKFGLGITASKPILINYKADVEIWDANLANWTLLDKSTVEIMAFGGTTTLVKEKTMKTKASTKEILIKVKNIRVNTTAGPISQEQISTTFKRP